MYGGILPLRDFTRTIAICLEPQHVHITVGHMPAKIVKHQTGLHIQKAIIRRGEHIGKGETDFVHDCVQADSRRRTLGRRLMAEMVCYSTFGSVIALIITKTCHNG